jgi:hypothetical protein
VEEDMRRLVNHLALACAFVVVPISLAFAGPVLYSQPAVFPPTVGSAYTSEIAGGTPRFQVWDEFTLGADGSIGGVQWQGVYIDDLGPVPFADATAFDVRFYADAGGVMGALLYNASFGIGQTNQTLVGSQTWFGQPSPVFNYSVDLPTAFSANGGTQYWLSIVAYSDVFRPVWAWTAGTGGNNSSVQDDFGDLNPPYGVGQDRAFTLTAVPEPGSLSLLGAGLLALSGLRRRKK